MKNLVWLCVISSFLAAHSACACSCKTGNLPNSIQWADVILVAEISSVTLENVTVLPIEVFKGKIIQPLIFRNATSAVGCNYFGSHDAHVGDRHLVFFISVPKEKPFLSICTSSGPIEKSADKLEVLRKQFRKDAKHDNPRATRP